MDRPGIIGLGLYVTLAFTWYNKLCHTVSNAFKDSLFLVLTPGKLQINIGNITMVFPWNIHQGNTRFGVPGILLVLITRRISGNNSLYFSGIYQENSRDILDAIHWYFPGKYTWEIPGTEALVFS